jgi:hypothetical protein
VPFPLIVLLAGLAGYAGTRFWPRAFADGAKQKGEKAAAETGGAERLPLVIDDGQPPPPHTLPSRARVLKVLGVGLALWVVPLAPLAGTDQRREAEAAIDGLAADGGTEVYPALSLALEALRTAAPAEKHLVLLTDGKSRTGTRQDYQALVEPAVADGITISTVAIGDDADTELMQFLAELGGGRYHLASRPEDIPSGVLVILGLSTSTPASEWQGYAPLDPTSVATPAAAPGGISSAPVVVPITVDGPGLLRGDPTAEADAVEQLEAGLAPFLAAGCQIGFVITEGTAPDIGTGNQIADAVNALMQRDLPELAGGAGFYSFASVGGPAGPVNLLVFPNAGCEVA